MYPKRSVATVLALWLAAWAQASGHQFTSGAWDSTGAFQQQQQLLLDQQQQQPLSAHLHSQVSALSSQIAAASRQLESLKQQLALVDQQRVPLSQPQFFGQPAQQQQPQEQEQAQPQPTTLVEPNEQLELSRPLARMFYPARRVQQQQQPARAPLQEPEQPLNAPLNSEPPPSTTNETPAQQEAPVQFAGGAPPLPLVGQQPPPHNPPRNDDKFAIGLGVLSPGYTQKFGNTALDFNQDKNGFSFTLSNNGHSNQPQQVKPAGQR